tara:strand:+ start:80 stop:1120 length:1041 start_codon:yes stop_codon:yes gene_type:complete
MAIQVSGTQVIGNSRELTNIASVDATTAASITAAGVGVSSINPTLLVGLQRSNQNIQGLGEYVIDDFQSIDGLADLAGFVKDPTTGLSATASAKHPDAGPGGTGMTSLTTPTPYVVTTQYTGAQPYTAWFSNSSYFGAYNATTQWIQLDIGSKGLITQYSLAASINASYNTTTHTVSGSNSADGSNSATLASNNGPGTRSIAGVTTGYRYYRINATGNGGFGTGQVWYGSNGVKTWVETTGYYPASLETISYNTVTSKDAAIIGVFAKVNGATINTDLKAYVSRNGGANYTTASSLSLVTATPAGENYYQMTADLSGLPSGTDLRLKVEAANSTVTSIRGVTLDWS